MQHDSSTPDIPRQFTGHDVVDEQGQKIGKVSDVIYGPNSDISHPRWLVVDTGLLSGAHYAPARQTFVATNGTVVASFDKRLVKTSPRAKGTHVLTPEMEHDLARHYAVAI